MGWLTYIILYPTDAWIEIISPVNTKAMTAAFMRTTKTGHHSQTTDVKREKHRRGQRTISLRTSDYAAHSG